MAIKEQERVFKALADRNRLRILKMLSSRSLSVGEIAGVLNLTQPSVSRHMRILRDAGLVDNRKTGSSANYFIAGENVFVRSLLKDLSFWLKGDETARKDMELIRRIVRKKIER